MYARTQAKSISRNLEKDGESIGSIWRKWITDHIDFSEGICQMQASIKPQSRKQLIPERNICFTVLCAEGMGRRRWRERDIVSPLVKLPQMYLHLHREIYNNDNWYFNNTLVKIVLYILQNFSFKNRENNNSPHITFYFI